MKQRLLRFWASLFAKPCFYKFNGFLFEAATRGLGINNFESESLSGEKYFIESILPLYCKGNSPLLIDVGANEGGYSAILKQNFPKADILAFEPHPVTCAKLTANVPGLTIRQAALGSTRGHITLYDHASSDGSQHASVYEAVIKDIHHSKPAGFEVPLETLDGLSVELGLNNGIQLLKVDTEGNEFEVLKGAGNLIQNGAIDVLHIEFNEMNVISRVFMRDIQNILGNYSAYRLLPNGALPLPDLPLLKELFGFQNIIFIHSRLNPGKDAKPARPQSAPHPTL